MWIEFGCLLKGAGLKNCWKHFHSFHVPAWCVCVCFSPSFGYLHYSNYRWKFAQQDQLDSTTKRTIMENEQMVRELSCCISTNLGLNILSCRSPFPIVWINVVIYIGYPFRVCQSRWLGYDAGYSWKCSPCLEHCLSSKIYEALVFYVEVRISDKRDVW